MRLRLRTFLSYCLFSALLACPGISEALQGKQQGKSLYTEHCAPCHGVHGDDGFGANLALPRLPQAPDDQALARLIKNGYEGTEMPPAYGVTDDEVRQIIAYTRSLGRAAAQGVPGNVSRGEQLYKIKGNCAQCHMLKGQGGRLGPDLSDIGVRRGPAHLRESLLDPNAAVPFQFLLVQVTTREGRKISGVRLNEDSFSIQIRDSSGSLYSFWKSDLEEIRKEWGKSTMPSIRDTFSLEELDDLVAFLASLRGSL